LNGMGGRLVNEQWRPALNSQAGMESLALFVEMFNYAPPHSENLSFTEANALFLQGRGAMYLTWPSLIWAQLNDTNTCKIAGKIGAAVIPGGKPQLSSWSLGVNPSCRDLDAAYRWVAFFMNPANTKRLLLQSKPAACGNRRRPKRRGPLLVPPSELEVTRMRHCVPAGGRLTWRPNFKRSS